MVDINLTSEGKVVSSLYQLLSVDIALEFNHIPWARLSFIDGDPSIPEFEITNAKDFAPGASIEIKISMADINGKETKASFKGIVVGQRLELNANQSVLVVEIQSKIRSMYASRQTRVFEKMKDSDIISKIIKSLNGLEVGKIADTTLEHEKMVQFDCTDWDFIISRAEANGCLIAVIDGKFNMIKADATSQPKLKFSYGISEIYDFELESDAARLFKKSKAISWDLKKHKRLDSRASSAYNSSFGNVANSSGAKSLSDPENRLLYGGAGIEKELDAWAKADEIRSRLSIMKGRICSNGLPNIQLGDFIELEGFGSRFNGKAIVSGMRHQVYNGMWTTDLQLGFSSQPFWQKEHIISPCAGGLLPGVNGLQIGVVSSFQEDPAKEFRVGVQIPAANDDANSFVWARLTAPDAGKERGWFFYPEVGDEVILGFLHDDPRQAIILGALFGSKNSPPKGLEKVDQDNAKKGIVTKGGHSVLFDDKEKLLTIRTSEKNTILMDEKNKKISIGDEHGNTITMSDEGITIKSDKVIKLEASGSTLKIDDNGVEMKSAKKMTLEASAAMEIKGAKIDLK